MFKYQVVICVSTFACMIVLLPNMAWARKHASKLDIENAIQNVQLATSPTAREDAAGQLAEMTRGVDSREFDDKMIADLISLLDRREGRIGVAVCLGNAGKRASAAIPKLQEVLPKEECARGEKTAADEIRYALNRMGVFPPPSHCQR